MHQSSSSSSNNPSDHFEAEDDSNRVGANPFPPPSYAEAARNSSSSLINSNHTLTIHQHLPPTPSDPSLHRFEITHRFPSGFFVLRNRSSLKLLDVSGSSTRLDNRLIAYNPKRPTLINGSLHHKDNHQLFFLDWNGCLCSASTGALVDVEDNRLIPFRPTPISSQPSRESHPPARFKYDPITRTISVHFLYDPTFSNSTVDQINSIDYLLELQPLSSSFSSSSSSSNHHNMGGSPLEKLSEWLPFSKPTPAHVTHHPSSSSSNGHRAHAQDPQDDPDQDDSPHPARELRVISIAPGWREKFPSSGSPEARKWLKRQWDIASIVVEPVIQHPERIGSSLESTHRRSSSSSAATLTGDRHPHEESPPLSSVLSDLGEALGDLGHELFLALGGSTSRSK